MQQSNDKETFKTFLKYHNKEIKLNLPTRQFMSIGGIKTCKEIKQWFNNKTETI